MSKNDGFLDILAGCTEAAANMSLKDNDWMPPDGTYEVILQDFATGTKESKGVTNGWARVTFQILDGQFEGKTFSDFFWLPPNQEKATMGLRNLCMLATCIHGDEVRNPVEASGIIESSASAEDMLSVEVYRSTSKGNGKVYCNVRPLQLLVEDSEAETCGANAIDAKVG